MSGENTQPVVRVGVFPMQGFMYIEADGSMSGYNAEYLRAVAQHTGWTYDFVLADSFDNAYTMFKDGQIDLLAPIQQLPGRMHSFSAFSIGILYGALLGHANDDSLSYEYYEQFSGKKTGIVENSSFHHRFLAYAAENGFAPDLVFFKTTAQLLDAFRERTVDMAVCDLMNYTEDMKVLAKFSPAPYYYAVSSKDSGLKKQLDAALSEIKTGFPLFENELIKKYLPVYLKTPISHDELEYVKSAPEFTVGIVPDRKPMSWYDEKERRCRGIAVDILDIVAERSGLVFRYEMMPLGSVGYQTLQEHSFHLISGVENTVLNSLVAGFPMSNPYFSSKKVFVGKKGINFDKTKPLRLALATGSKTLPVIAREKYPAFIIHRYDTIKETMDAVLHGEADILMQNQYAIEEIMLRPQYENLVVIPEEAVDDQNCLAAIVYQNGSDPDPYLSDPRLFSVLNKTIDSINENELMQIVVSNTIARLTGITFSDFVYKFRNVLGTFLLLILLCFCTVWYVFALRRRNAAIVQNYTLQELREQKRHLLLMEKAGDIMYEIDMLQGKVTASGTFTRKFGWHLPSIISAEDCSKWIFEWQIHQHDRNVFRQMMEKSLYSHEDSEAVVRIAYASGGYCWCRISQYVLKNNDNSTEWLLGRIVDINDVVTEKEQLLEKSRIDQLTGLYRKEVFYLEVSQYLAAQRAGSLNAIVFMDLDNFKYVNDKLGHMIGDKAISDAAKKLRLAFSNCDLIARFGGDEFCILIKDITLAVLSDRLNWLVGKMRHTYSSETEHVEVTASIGAVMISDPTVPLETLLTKADGALYAVKKSGKDSFRIV